MQNTIPKREKRIVVLSSAVCFIIIMIFYALMLNHDIATEKERYQYVAKNEAEHIITTIDCVMARTNTLKALIQDHNGDTSFFNSVAEDIYNTVIDETGVSLKNFAIAPDGVVSEIYPLEGNESFLGFDFLDTSLEGNLEAKQAYEEGNTILTNPFHLVQGGVGMAGRAPVLLRENGRSRLWGLVTVTIDFDNLIEVLRLDNLHGMGVDYTFSYIDTDGSTHEMHSYGTPDDSAVKMRFKVRNLTWELAVQPSKGWFPVWRITFSILAILIISCFAGIFVSTVFQLRKSNKILLQLSNTDRLTGCMNRRAYEEALSRFFQKSPEKNFVYVTADVNGLKEVNDTQGHLSGDELICGATECLNKSLAAYGEIYRIGGDEFAALLFADEKKLTEIIEELKNLADKWEGENVKKLSISVGYASSFEYPDWPINKLIETADDRMYEAKRR